MNPSPPRLALFDMDDALCAYSHPARAAYLARLAGTTAEAVLDAIWASGFEAHGDSGALDAQAYLRDFGERIGYALASTNGLARAGPAWRRGSRCWTWCAGCASGHGWPCLPTTRRWLRTMWAGCSPS